MAALSGQITVATAGTAVQGPATPTGRHFAIKAHADNTDTVWVGNDGNGDVTSGNGFPLNAGEGIVLDIQKVAGGSLAGLWIDADVNGEKVCWILMNK